MGEDGFRAFLAASGYTANAVASRMSRCRAVERRLRVDLDAVDLDEEVFAVLRRRLDAPGRSAAVVAGELNALRRYRDFRAGRTPDATAPSSRPSPPPSAAIAPHPLLAPMATGDILALYGDLLGELRRRGVCRTENSPVGDYAEHLFAAAFGWTLENNSKRGVDACDAAGRRYQIKARRRTGAPGWRQLSAIRGIGRRSFDTLAAVLFERDMTIARAVMLPWALAQRVAVPSGHTNSHRLMLTDAVIADPSVEDVTERLRAAAAALS